VTRRTPIAIGFALAASLLSACTTFNRTDTAASINGHDLSRTELAAIDGNIDSGDSVRAAITTWLQLGVMGGDTAGITTSAELDTRMKAAITALSTPYLPQAKANYELGLDGAPLLCLRAIPIVVPNTPDTVLAALNSGTSFADAAAKFSSDPTLAANGGIIGDGQGTDCLDPAKQLSPELVKVMKAAKLQVGVPAAITFRKNDIIMLIRPFDELATQQKAAFAQSLITEDLKHRLDAAHIYVNPRFGRWDVKSASVLVLSPG
jgi:hypothetical protein